MGAHINQAMKLNPGMKLIDFEAKTPREGGPLLSERKRSVQEYLRMRRQGESDLDPQNLYGR